jgi:hypothetical protein
MGAVFLAGLGASGLLLAAGGFGRPPELGAVRPLDVSVREEARGAEASLAGRPRADARPEPARDADADSGLPAGGPSPWWTVPGPAVEVRIGAHVAHATPARFDRTALDRVEAGDRITLTLPEVGALDVVVQRIASPSPSVRLLHGHLADPVEEYPATLTLGPVFSFANVTTPTGTWIAEFENGAGWILYDDLEDQLVDHRASDGWLPPQGEGAG